MSKATQYFIDDTKVCTGFLKMSPKGAQTSLQKIVAWTKKFGKGRQKWKDSCIIVGLPSKMLKILVKTKFASQVIFFQETLTYQDAISICYGWQQTLHLQSKVPNC